MKLLEIPDELVREGQARGGKQVIAGRRFMPGVTVHDETTGLQMPVPVNVAGFLLEVTPEQIAKLQADNRLWVYVALFGQGQGMAVDAEPVEAPPAKPPHPFLNSNGDGPPAATE